MVKYLVKNGCGTGRQFSVSHLRSQRQLTFANTPINSAFTFTHIFLLFMLADCSILKKNIVYTVTCNI
jgi:hypothetical protein